jgi:hypothetical protein
VVSVDQTLGASEAENTERTVMVLFNASRGIRYFVEEEMKRQSDEQRERHW